MKLWTSGELQADIDEAVMAASLKLEKTFNPAFCDKNYGSGLRELAHIAIVRVVESPDYGEFKKYRKKSREVEFRLKIPHSACLQADELGMLKLVASSVLRAVRLMRDMKIPDFDAPTFEADFQAFLEKNGWA